MEELYYIMIETFSNKAKLKKHERKVMAYAPVFEEDGCSVKVWNEIKLESGFPLDFKPADTDKVKDKCGEETTYNSTYEFKLMTCDEVLTLLEKIESEDNIVEKIDG